jgi:hypothetical protein
MDERGKTVPDWQLERLAQGELDDAARGEIERKLGKEEMQRRLAALETSNRAVLDSLPPPLMAATIRRRLNERRTPRGRLLMVVLPLAMAAGVWAVGFSPRLASAPDQGPEETRVKGATKLLAYRAGKDAKLERLANAAKVRPHDMVQLAYTAGEGERRFGAVLSVDGRGVITQHLPVNAPAAIPLATGGKTDLPRSYELDDAPGFERFFFVTSSRPFSLAEVLDAARALAGTGDARRKPLPLPAGLSQESLLLEKVQP